MIAALMSIVCFGCGRSQNRAGRSMGDSGGGGLIADGGSTWDGPSGTGGVTSGSTLATGGYGGTDGGNGGTSMGSGGQNATGGVTGGEVSTGSGGTVISGGTTTAGGRTGTGGTSEAGGTLGPDGGPSDVPADTAAPGPDGGLGTGGLGGGIPGTGGAATGGSTSTGTGTVTIDCDAPMPSGGTRHSENGTGGVSGDLTWLFWQNGNGASMTSFSVPAFSASWGPDSGDVMVQIGLDWGDSGKTYDQYGTMTAQFAERKSGSGGSYSYIGVYGLTSNPCVEFYIVDDSYDAMPVMAYVSSKKGSAKIDGETYTFWVHAMTGTGSPVCGGRTVTWNQYHSIRQTARTCGQISITEHFNAWKAAGMTLGSLVEVKVIVEAGGGTGSIDFPIANLMTQ